MRINAELQEILKKEHVEIEHQDIRGCFGRFKRGRYKGWTICWTWHNGWEHVSIDAKTRMPTWQEMCDFKDMFFYDEETVVQYHPKKSQYVNIAPYCLHLWKPIEKYTGPLPYPNPKLVSGEM